MTEQARLSVIFDFDGVIVDSEPVHFRALLEAAAPHGVSCTWEAYLDRYVGYDDRDAFREMWRDSGRTPPEGAALERLVEEKTALFQRLVATGAREFPGARGLIAELRERGVPLAVASGSHRAEIEAILSAFGLRDAFPVIASTDMVERSKPHPETYLLALRLMREHYGQGIAAGRTVAIEDTQAGVEAALGAGLRVLAVAHTSPPEALGRAHEVAESLALVTPERLFRLLNGA